MNSKAPALLTLAFALAVPQWIVATSALAGPAYTDPAQADEDFAYQGEYTGEIDTGDGKLKVGLQVVALGQGKFRGVGYAGGLPGAGWVKGEGRQEAAEGELKDGKIRFQGALGIAEVSPDKATILSLDGDEIGSLEKVERKSPTLGAKAPEDAKVLFDGSSADAWKNGRMTDDGLLMEGVTSKETFQDHKLHLEFLLPYQPEDRGQGRGNSGVYVQGRYEVQVLDSFGLEGRDNECGGIYSVQAPAVNMCFPPLAWQTYDIEFRAARFDADGKRTEPARMTVYHNGVKIHDNVEVPRGTPGGPSQEGAEAGPVYFQDHGNPVRFRNVWVEPIEG